MAEGLLGGLIGEAEDEPEESQREALASAEAFAAAIAADHAKYDPDVARAATEFLRDQSRLLREQTEQVKAERHLRLHHLHCQTRDGRIRRAGARIRVAMQLFVALIATVVGAFLVSMFYDAVASRTVVVEAFKAPSILASRGLTGDVVASGVLDALEKLREATRDANAGMKTTGAWATDIKIELPETGVSVGEISRLLHQRFGHDVRIDGDLVQTDRGGLALTVRGDGVPAKTFEGPAASLGGLTTQAAEYVYGRSQPQAMATYLQSTGRYGETLEFLPGAMARARDDEARCKVANSWGTTFEGLNKPVQAAEKLRLARTLCPRYATLWWTSWDDLVGTILLQGNEEAAWRESRALLSEADRAPKDKRPELRNVANASQITWDLPLALASALEDASRNGGAGASLVIAGPALAEFYWLLHDPSHAARYMASSDPDDPTTKAESLLIAGYAALEIGDAAGAVGPLEKFYKAWQADTTLQFTYTDNPCFLGLAYGLAGRAADAETVFKHIGPWSRCVAFYGDVLAHAGDEAGARRVWSAGLASGPDLPMIYLHRGLFELGRNDLAAAEADLSTARTKAPHFADPLKAWGDLLARRGDATGAVAKYEEAAKYAPAWVELGQAKEAVLFCKKGPKNSC